MHRARSEYKTWTILNINSFVNWIRIRIHRLNHFRCVWVWCSFHFLLVPLLFGRCISLCNAFALYTQFKTRFIFIYFAFAIQTRKKHSMQLQKYTYICDRWSMRERKRERKEGTHKYTSTSKLLIFRTLNLISYVFFVLAPYHCPLQYGWIDIGPSISGKRAKEREKRLKMVIAASDHGCVFSI